LVAKIININPTYLFYIYLLILTTSGRVARGFKKSSSLKKLNRKPYLTKQPDIGQKKCTLLNCMCI